MKLTVSCIGGTHILGAFYKSSVISVVDYLTVANITACSLESMGAKIIIDVRPVVN